MTAQADAWLHGAALRVLGAPGHARRLDPYLAPLRAPVAPDAPVFTLTIAAQDEDPDPRGALPLAEGPLPEGPEARLFTTADGLLLIVPGRLSLRLARGEGWIGVAPGGEALIGGTPGIVAIEAAAGLAGQALVHAAALTLPGRHSALLLAAPSGAGKTTAALALALGGFGLLTDDAAMLRPAPEGMTVWGLPRGLKVHRETLGLLPALAPALGGAWDAAGEQALPRARLAGIVPVPEASPVPVGAVVFVGQRRGAPGHEVRPLPRAELLLRLAADNLGRGPAGLPETERRRWTVLSAAVAAARCFELCAGTDLAALPAALLAETGL
ncbi:MAG: hypothetical protein ACK4PG_00535 [Acetobacteraceae bacterium]